ncbi:MAG: cupin domain-containing protein [Chitinispirillaceae bacterium]|nr:cupin domain-containing protein [Chitinispirillaceae bacterium]
MTTKNFFTVFYLLSPPPGVPPEVFAQNVAEEQTVELPHESIPDRHFETCIVGTVDSITAAKGGAFRVAIRYRNDIAVCSIPQFLNTLFGNISLQNGIKIVGLELPEHCMTAFSGPRRGIDGIRQLLGIYRRPLLSTALKPLGLSCTELAQIAGACARGGIDIIKDDHGINNQHFHPFEERLGRVTEAIAAANASTGGTTLYFPNICGPFEEIESQVHFALRNGIRGILIAPQLVGFDMMHYLAEKYGVMIMAHPSFSGTLFSSPSHGIAPSIFLGTIFRLFGADISIFPSWGGRFAFSRRECAAIAAALTCDLPLRRAFPAPAGGMRLERFDEVAAVYGEETVLLVGGNLLGRSSDHCTSTALFMETIRGRFGEERRQPEEPRGSSCECLPRVERNAAVDDLLRFDDFNWKNRRRTEYKPGEATGFSGVKRIELFGRSGTKTAFDLRYFEIEKGGYSSFEKHLHEHVIIGVRGSGVLFKNGGRLALRPHDIAYIGPFEPHQLRNEHETPFGFYCIVDHNRDWPVSCAPRADYP